MKKLLLLFALLFVSIAGSQNLLSGPVVVTNANTAAGTPDFYVRPTNKQLAKMPWSSVYESFSESLRIDGFLTSPSTLEYPNFASFPNPGLTAVVYIAQDTGFGYTWTGSTYVPIASTGISGLGRVTRLPVWTAGNIIGNSNFFDTGSVGRYVNPLNSDQYVEFLRNASAFLRIARAQSRFDFALGAGGSGVFSTIYSSQEQEGLDIWSEGDLLLSSGSSPAATNPIRRLYINRLTGNVGIGTGLTASDRLHVSGNLRVTGGFKDSSNNIGSSGQVLTSTATGTAWASPSSIGSGIFMPTSGGTFTGDIQVLTVPPNANSAVSKNYLDNLIYGLNWKKSVKCATTVNHSLSGTSNVDGVTVPPGTRVLVHKQTNAWENGIYITAAGSWTRALGATMTSDFDGLVVTVTNGTTYGNKGMRCLSTDVIVGTNDIVFDIAFGAGTYVNGAGLDLTANVFSISIGGVTNAMLAGSITDSKILSAAYWNAKEDSFNKSTSIILDQTSNVKYPTVKSVFDYTIATFLQPSTAASTYETIANVSLKKSIATGNSYKWETTNSLGNLQETTVTPNRAVATDSNGLPVASATTATELGRVSGVTSPIQEQFDNIPKHNDLYVLEDFLSNTNVYTNLTLNSAFKLSQNSSGTAVNTTNIPPVYDLKNQGVTYIRPNPNANYYVGVTTDDKVKIGQGEILMEEFVLIEDLTSGTGYSKWFGLLTSPSSVQTNGIFFALEYGSGGGVHSTASNTWKCITASSGSTTVYDTGVVASTSSWVKLSIVINSAGTAATFFINGSPVGSPISTNIPTARMYFGTMFLNKSATAHGFWADYLKLWYKGIR